MFRTAVKQAKRLSKRINKKPTDDSEDDEDDLVRIELKGFYGPVFTYIFQKKIMH